VWQTRQLFLDVAQGRIPAIGRYLRFYGYRAEQNARAEVIRKWQKRFNLLPHWAFESAEFTLKMWARSDDLRRTLNLWAAPDPKDLTAFPFHVLIERPYYSGTDFVVFSQSVHSAVEAELEAFRKKVGADGGTRRRAPTDLRRACECLVWRVCKGLSPSEVSSRTQPRDWTVLARDMKSIAEIIGIETVRRGRPSKKRE
jgi:hypothetical protein